MDPATIKRITRISNIVYKAFREYMRNDQKASYPLSGDVWVVIKGGRVARSVPQSTRFTTADGSVSIEKGDENVVRVTAHKFMRAPKLWNGPDVLPNNELASMFASLFHDLMWGHRAEIGEALGMTPKQVMRLANDVFVLAWRAIDPSLKGRIKSYFAFQAVSAAVPWWPAVKKALAGVTLACLLSGCEGCFSLPGGEVEEVGGVDVVQSVMDQYGDGLGPDPVEDTEADNGWSD